MYTIARGRSRKMKKEENKWAGEAKRAGKSDTGEEAKKVLKNVIYKEIKEKQEELVYGMQYLRNVFIRRQK